MIDNAADSEPDLTNLRHGKVVIMPDADVDGAHIQTLPLTLFYRHFYTSRSRRSTASMCRRRAGSLLPSAFYAPDEGELDAIKNRLAKEGFSPNKIEVGRFKGLGEMNPEQLRETPMAPATRRVLPVAEWPESRDEMLGSATGMSYAGASFSGKVDFNLTEMTWPLNHMVAPKENALAYKECHQPNGRVKNLPGLHVGPY